MEGDDDLMATVYRKIEREKALITAATNMRQSTDNHLVQQRVDANIRDGRKNIAYLEEKMRELQLRKMGRDPDQPTSPTGQQHPGNDYGATPPPPPPKDTGRFAPNEPGDYGEIGPGGYSQGGTGVMPPRAPFHDPRPEGSMPKARPNFSKLGKSLMLLYAAYPVILKTALSC